MSLRSGTCSNMLLREGAEKINKHGTALVKTSFSILSRCCEMINWLFISLSSL